MRTMIFIFVALTLWMPTTTQASGDITAEERYEKVKEQTKHTGSVGFDKRHQAYRDYIMEQRQDAAGNVAEIAPAAGGDEAGTTPQENETNE